MKRMGTIGITVLALALTAHAAENTANNKKTKKFRTPSSEASSTASSTASDAHNVNLSSQSISDIAGSLNANKLQNNSISAYNYFAAPGTQAVTVTPRLVTGDSEITYKLQGNKIKNEKSSDGTSLGFAFDHGLQNGLALKVNFSADNINSSTKFKSNGNSSSEDGTNSGLSDIAVSLINAGAPDATQFYFGGVAKLSLGDQTEDNNYSGGPSFGAVLGKQYNLGDTVAGYEGAFLFNLEKRGEFSGTTTKRTGEHQFAGNVFVEFPKASYTYGAKAGLAHFTDSDLEMSGETFSTNPYDVMSLEAYGNVKFNSDFQLKPAFKIQRVLSASGGEASIDSANELTVELAAQMAL